MCKSKDAIDKHVIRVVMVAKDEIRDERENTDLKRRHLFDNRCHH